MEQILITRDLDEFYKEYYDKNIILGEVAMNEENDFITINKVNLEKTFSLKSDKPHYTLIRKFKTSPTETKTYQHRITRIGIWDSYDGYVNIVETNDGKFLIQILCPSSTYFNNSKINIEETNEEVLKDAVVVFIGDEDNSFDNGIFIPIYQINTLPNMLSEKAVVNFFGCLNPQILSFNLSNLDKDTITIIYSGVNKETGEDIEMEITLRSFFVINVHESGSE